MRVAWMVAALAAMAGCLDPAASEDDHGGLGWTTAAAAMAELEDSQALSDYTLISATAREGLSGDGPAIQGLAPSWRLTYGDLETERFLTYDVRTGSTPERVDEGDLQDRNLSFRCQARSSVDSQDIAAALLESEAWARAGVPATGHVTYTLDCLARTPAWQVDTPMVPNTDGSVSARSFFFTPNGTFGGYIGDGSAGAPESVSMGHGLNVQPQIMAFDFSTPGTSSTQRLTVNNAPRAAVVLEPRGFTGSGMPFATGNLIVIDPSGGGHETPWDAGPLGTTPTGLLIDPVGFDAYHGAWNLTVTLDVDSSPGLVLVHFCTGIPYGPSNSNPACAMLYDARL